MTYELWIEDEGADGKDSMLIPADHPQKASLTANAALQWSCEADSWEEAMNKYHEHMGWEPYKPTES